MHPLGGGATQQSYPFAVVQHILFQSLVNTFLNFFDHAPLKFTTKCLLFLQPNQEINKPCRVMVSVSRVGLTLHQPFGQQD